MPQRWNGTLLIYFSDTEGRVAVMADPAAAGTAAVAPDATDGAASVIDPLLKAGFALAGAGVAESGWQADAQLEAADRLRQYFIEANGKPQRIYAWGSGSGAVAAVRLGQTRDWVAGTAPLCGMFAGITANYDLALDSAFAVRELLAPKLKLTGYTSLAHARHEYRYAMAAVHAAATSPDRKAQARLRIVGVAAALPTRSRDDSGSGPVGSPASVEAALSVTLARSTMGRYLLAKQLGADPSDNSATDYYARLSAAAQRRIDMSAPGASVKYLTKIQHGTRVSASPIARTNAAGSAPAADPRVPMVGLATENDPAAVIANSAVFVRHASAAGEHASRLVHANVAVPPLFYPASGRAPYGAGHCAFTAASITGTVSVLNDWVRDGLYPTDSSMQRLLGAGSGVTLPYRFERWPAGTEQP